MRPAPAPLTAVGLVAVGGAVGGLLRAAARELLPSSPGDWPWSTLVVNGLGAFALAALLCVLARAPSERARLLLGTGLLGALTTFSGLAVEAVLLVDTGRPAAAAAYVVVSVAVLLACAALGVRAVRR